MKHEVKESFVNPPYQFVVIEIATGKFRAFTMTRHEADSLARQLDLRGWIEVYA